MIKYLDHVKMGSADHGWLRSRFHFSFAQYYNPDNMGFGNLRVLNDDLVRPGTGFETHPHRDMEIISYVVEGELTHGDSMGNRQTLKRGQIQYMSAGTGVWHSEHNLGQDMLRFLQIWIYPDAQGYPPAYGDYPFPWEDREGRFLHLVSGRGGAAPVQISQDANIYALALEKGKAASFPLAADRQAYLVQIEGTTSVSGHILKERDALEAVEESLDIKALEASHFLLIEMKKG